MYLTLSKKFEMSSSHRLFVENMTADENFALYGKESLGHYGHGHNYDAYFSFNGKVDDKTGMMINVTEIKAKIKKELYPRYDHRYLNNDTLPFDKLSPTAENIAKQMLLEARELFQNSNATPVVCHLRESAKKEATIYANGKTESHYWLDFSSARVTRSPNLTNDENQKLFGAASSATGHGHHYHLRVTIEGTIDETHGMIIPDNKVYPVLREIFDMFDHKNISTDIPKFEKLPTTTESMAKVIFELLSKKLPVNRIKLYENDNFFVEYDQNQKMTMSIRDNFNAAHRLHSNQLDDSANLEVFDVCNNLMGHGHEYRLEITISGEYDKLTGTLFDLGEFIDLTRKVLDPWDYKHLNLDTNDFENKVPTGENIIEILWNKFNPILGNKLQRLRLWETTNNRFTLRRDITE